MFCWNAQWQNPNESGVTAQKNIWKGERWGNLAWGEVAAGSFSGVECVGKCQERISTQFLRRENDQRNINYWLQFWFNTKKFSGFSFYSALLYLYLIFESFISVCKLNLYWMHEPGLQQQLGLMGLLSTNPASATGHKSQDFYLTTGTGRKQRGGRN